MRQIGVNQYAGEHPAIIESMLEVEIEIKKHTDYAREKFNRLDPVHRLITLLNKNIYRPFKTGQLYKQEVYFPNEYTWLELSKLDKFDGVPDASKFIMKLDVLYVIDLYRGKGYGRHALKILKEHAIEAGCMIILYCNPFGVTNCDRPMAFTSMKDYIAKWFDDTWQPIYEPDCEADVTKFFYSESGLTNMCLFENDDLELPEEDRLPVDRHFGFIPDTLKQQYREQIQDRLNIDLCEYCK